MDGMTDQTFTLGDLCRALVVIEPAPYREEIITDETGHSTLKRTPLPFETLNLGAE